MRALLDTHTFLWWNLDTPRLSPRARDLIGDGGNEFLLSVVSVWEIAIKHARGRLDLPRPPAEYLPDRIAHYGYEPLRVEVSHALQAGSLSAHHNDPFDRLLIAQALVERLPILSADPHFARYGVEVIW